MWTKLDDGFLDHPKVAAIGPLGIALHVSGMVFCGRQLTDGYVAAPVVPRLVDFSQVAELSDLEEAMGDVIVAGSRVNGWSIVRNLVDAEVWHDYRTIESCNRCWKLWPVGRRDGYYIHDYLVYNPTREQVLADRKERREQQSEAGKRSAEVRRAKYGTAQPNGTPNDPPNGRSTMSPNDSPNAFERAPNPAPAPVPDPIETKIKTLADSPSANGGEVGTAWVQAPGLSQTQNHFVAKLGGDVGTWAKATNKANAKYGKPVVTTALGHMAEYGGQWEKPYAALEAECQSVAKKEPA